jgi:catechol-2,3-dioxygenase
MTNGFAELTLETADLDAMARFYRDVVGLWTPGTKEFGDRGGHHVHFAFAAAPERLDALAARLRAEGVDVRGPVEHPGGDRSIYFADPAGNVVEAWDRAA